MPARSEPQKSIGPSARLFPDDDCTTKTCRNTAIHASNPPQPQPAPPEQAANEQEKSKTWQKAADNEPVGLQSGRTMRKICISPFICLSVYQLLV